MSEIIEGNAYSNSHMQTAKSVIQGHYSFIKTFFFWGMIPSFLLTGALKSLQLDLLHHSLTQGEILNMMYFRVATLFILGCIVVYFILILAGLWRAAMRIKNETLRMTAKTITSVLTIIWLLMLVLLVKAQFEYLIESIKYSDYVTPKVYPIGVLVFLPYLFLFTDTQLVALGFTPANQAANKTQLSENGKLAFLLILFLIPWILTLVFLPNAYDEDRYVFKGEPTFNLPAGYEHVTYSNNLQGYIRNKNNNVREALTPNENEPKLPLQSQSQVNENTQSDSSVKEQAISNAVLPSLPRCYSLFGNERIYHDFKNGECIDD